MDRVGLALLSPLHVSHISVVEPSLVYIDKPSPFLQLVQESLGKQLPHSEATLGVALEGHECYSLVAHTKAAS